MLSMCYLQVATAQARISKWYMDRTNGSDNAQEQLAWKGSIFSADLILFLKFFSFIILLGCKRFPKHQLRRFLLNETVWHLRFQIVNFFLAYLACIAGSDLAVLAFPRKTVLELLKLHAESQRPRLFLYRILLNDAQSLGISEIWGFLTNPMRKEKKYQAAGAQKCRYFYLGWYYVWYIIDDLAWYKFMIIDRDWEAQGRLIIS